MAGDDSDLGIAAAGTNAQRSYWCFISYRHADNKEPGRQWATWLHQALETFEVPADLVGKMNQRGQPIPERIYPVFRDEEELPADADLSRPIDMALAHSRYLVVLCSPSAVQSRFVAEEILRFKQLGKEDAILAAIIAGEPNASDDPGKKHLEECFPRPLRFRVDEGGMLTAERCEPIAADFRLPDGSPGWTTPAAYREALLNAGIPRAEASASVAAYTKHVHVMLLKIIAGVLAVPLGELTKRDQAYQLELQRRRARALRRWLTAVTALSLAAVAAGVLAYRNAVNFRRQRDVADQKTVESRGRLVRMMLERARGEQVAGNEVAALPWLLEGAKLDAQQPEPASRLHVSRIRGMLAVAPQLEHVAFHESAVNDAAFSPDGSRFVTASADYTARIWDAATGLPVGAVMEHDDPVRSAAFSPDGRLVVTAAGDKTGRRGAGSARVWDARTGAAITPPLRHAGKTKAEAGVEGVKGSRVSDYVISHAGAVTLARFSPDSGTVVSAGDDRTARLWNAADGAPIGAALEHADDVSAVAFSPTGDLLATGDESGAVRLWDAKTGRELKLPQEEPHAVAQVTNVEFSPDGSRLVASGGNTVVVWNVATRTQEREFPIDFTSAFRSSFAAFSPDGKSLAVQNTARTLRFWSFTSDEWVDLGKPIEHDKLAGFAFGGTGRRLVTWGEGVRVWDANVRTPVTGVLPYSTGDGWSEKPVAGLSPDETRVVVARGREHAAEVWTMREQTVFAFGTGDGLQAEFVGESTFSLDGSVAVVRRESRVRAWNPRTGAPTSDTIHLPGDVSDVRLSDHGRFAAITHGIPLANGRGDGITLWEPATGAMRTLDLPSVPAQRPRRQQRVLAFSPDERLVAVGFADGTTRVIDTAAGEPRATLQSVHPIVALTFSVDGSLLAVASSVDDPFDTEAQAEAQVWRLPEATPAGPRVMCKGRIDQLVLDADGTILVTRGRYPLPGAGAVFPRIVAVWEVDTGRPLVGPKDPSADDDDVIRQIGGSLWAEGGAARLLALASQGEARIFSADEGVFAAPSGDQITLRESSTGSLVPTLPIVATPSDTDFSRAVSFSPDGRLLAAVGQRDWTRKPQLGVWDVATGDRFLADMPLPFDRRVDRVLFSPAGDSVQVECGTAVWQVPVDRGPSSSVDGLDDDVELASGLRIDREREAALVPIDLAAVWNRRTTTPATEAPSRVAEPLADARRFLADRQFLAAAKALERAIAARKPVPAEWHLLLALAHLELNADEVARHDASLAYQAAMTAIAALPEPRRAAAKESDSHRSLVSQVQAVFGIAASRQGRWQDAVRHLEAATATSYPDTAWFKPLAFAYAESDEKQRRRKAFDALTRYDPDGIMSELGDDLSSAEQEGQLGIQRLIWDKAIADDSPEWLDRWEANHPAALRAARGRVSFRLNNWKQAIDDLTAAIDGNAGVAWAPKFRAAAYERLGEREKALADYDSAIEATKGQDIEAVALRGRLRRETGDLDGAIADATAVITAQPQSPDGWLDRAKARIEQAGAAAALPDLDQAVRLGKGEDPEALDRRASVLHELGRHEDAALNETAAIELDPENATFRARRALFRAAAGEFAQAEADGLAAIALDGDSVLARLAYAACLRAQDKCDAAIEHQRRAAELEPENPWPWRELARTAVRVQRFEQAVRDASRAIELDPRADGTLAFRAGCHTALRHWDEAIADVRAAAKLAPDDVIHPAGEVLLLVAAGRGEEARAAAMRLGERFLTDDSDWEDAVTAFETALVLEPPPLDFAKLRRRFIAARGREPDAERLVAICDAELGRDEAAATRLDDLAADSDGTGDAIATAYLEYCRRRLGSIAAANEHAVRFEALMQSAARQDDAESRIRDTILTELLGRRLRAKHRP